MISRTSITYVLLLIVQILLCNFGNFSQYVILCFLPIMVLFLPVQTGILASLLIAFLSGLFVDFFSDGMLGLRAAALLPVAFSRFRIISLIFGEGILFRNENLSFKKAGTLRTAVAALIANSLFLTVFTLLDNAGTLSFGVGTARFFASLMASTVISIFIASLSDTKEDSRWN